jgi:hypothetical protein
VTLGTPAFAEEVGVGVGPVGAGVTIGERHRAGIGTATVPRP